jgi:integrase
VAEVVALYLDKVKVENEPETYAQYRRNLNKFVREHGTQQARQITPLDAQNFKNRLVTSVSLRTGKPLKNRTVNIALIILRCCWNWAIESEGLGLVKNPFQKIDLLPEYERQRIATNAEFQLLLRHSDALFRQVLLCCRYMPIRPQDLRTLQWVGENYVDFENHCWVIRKDKTVKTRKNKQPKIIMMPPFIESLLRWRQKHAGGSPYVFVNEDGNPWRRDSLVLRMRRLRERAEIKPDANGEEFMLYTNRHTYLTNAATVCTPAELQAQAGHTDYRTTRRYVHLAQQHKVIADAARRAVDVLRPKRPAGDA